MLSHRVDGLGPCTLTGDDNDEHWGDIRDVRGLLTSRVGEGRREIDLIGCAPRGKLRRCLDSRPAGEVQVGNARLDVLDADGVSMGSYFVSGMALTGLRPSVLGSGLTDLGVTVDCDNAAYGGEWVWNLIRDGELNRRNIWRGLDAAERTAWLAVALWTSAYQRRGRPDQAAGHVFTLDGRTITDMVSFYCALGEAINGPGGYFGWNLDALADCLRGGWGATNPFTLEWLYSEVAREHLLTSHDPANGQPRFDLLLEVFQENGIEVILR
ncbi:barstar family protein [Nocardia otitidiscaviarum]|nr:barstar family protein [Nocardia otitidiscaviarum]MBF6178614.1 barstar family protein [Nocardia otitidiscaviarum]